MLSLSHVQRIYLSRSPADMRKQAPGLAAMVTELFEKDPLSGDAYVFLNKGRSIVRILLWDISGFWVASKKLERGCYAGRRSQAAPGSKGCHALSVAELMNILEGIDVKNAAYHQHYAASPSILTVGK
jgi:hypothetical protein